MHSAGLHVSIGSVNAEKLREGVSKRPAASLAAGTHTLWRAFTEQELMNGHSHARRALTMFATLCGLAVVAQAEPLSVVNPSFEADVAPPNGFALVVPTGWTLHDPGMIVDQSLDAVGSLNTTGGMFFPDGATDGQQVALIYLAGDVGEGEVGISQTLPHLALAGRRYTLRVDVGDIDSGFGPPGNTFYNLEGFPGYRIDLFAGNVLLARDNDELNGLIPEGEFLTSELTVDVRAGDPGVGQPLRIMLVNLNRPGTAAAPGIEVDFDHVRLDVAEIPSDCPADLDQSGEADLADFLAFFNCYDAAEECADIDDVEGVDFADFLTFFNSYDAGC